MEICFDGEIPVYGRWNGPYGFIDGGETFPRREVQTEKLFLEGDAVCVRERDRKRFERYHPGGTDYDRGGQLLRIDLPAGIYDVAVLCAGDRESVALSISGMEPDRVLQGGFWDAGELVPVRFPARWEGNVWRYTYINGRDFVVIALEPRRPDETVGIRRVRIERRGETFGGGAEALPCIRILGDSTAKSYVFEEAPMSGWGQIFYRMADAGRAEVINYSNGGRSLRIMYQEGRLNDMLLSGRPGDFVLLQSGHNDERARNEGPEPDGEDSRFGRGSTEEMYYDLLTKVFLPSIRCAGMTPVLVTPVTRINAGCGDDAVFVNSFRKRDFPAVMRRAAEDTGTLLLDLNARSVEHFNQIGPQGARAMVMSLEPGETPGKTNSGSYANGNPGNHADGTHYKECLSRQYCRMAVLEIAGAAGRGNPVALALRELLRENVRQAAESGDFSEVFPEVCRDTVAGRRAYYRNQIEKMVEIGVFSKDEEGNFYPFGLCSRGEFREGIRRIWGLSREFAGEPGEASKEEEPFLRMEAAEILYDAYGLRFGFGEAGKPPYMTDYNGRNISPEDPNYDVNLPEGETMYYPLTAFEDIVDLEELPEGTLEKLETVYRLGLMRCEGEGETSRGSLKNGTRFGPFRLVTRESAAKYLYFCFVLGQNIKKENHLTDLKDHTILESLKS